MSKENLLANIELAQKEINNRNKADEKQIQEDANKIKDEYKRGNADTLQKTQKNVDTLKKDQQQRTSNIETRTQNSKDLDAIKKIFSESTDQTIDGDSNLFPVVDEILAMNNMLNQHPTTGKYISGEYTSGSKSEQGSYREKQKAIIKGYRNKLFGAPFQLLDSVDARFSSVNEFVGYEYLRNFLIHTPIIHIYPGLPRYTGNDESILDTMVSFYEKMSQDLKRQEQGLTPENKQEFLNPISAIKEFLTNPTFQENYKATTGMIETSILKLFLRAKLQKRLFGITFKYEEYLRYVKLLCHGVALLLKLTGDDSYIANEYPNGTFVNTNIYESQISADDMAKMSNKQIDEYTQNLLKQYNDRANNKYNFKTFKDINWGNYRMIEDQDSVAYDPDLTFKKSIEAVSGVSGELGNIAKEAIGSLGDMAKVAWDGTIGSFSAAFNGLASATDFDSIFTNTFDAYGDKIKNDLKILGDRANNIQKSIGKIAKGIFEVNYDIGSRTQSIEFMIQPSSFQETYTNETGDSKISQMAEQVNEAGAEVSFLTNSSAVNTIGKTMIDTTAGMTTSLAQALGSIATPFTGNFLSNLFTGAIGAITGNRFIYPKIYKRSSTEGRHFDCSVKLSSPYGDLYNYYMNIIVPLCHIQAFTLPKLKTSNSVNSPYIVRAFIPGLMTCELGMVSQLRITKNPSNNRVSINNFPLDVDVSFSIESLYDHLAISPTDDGLSYINNETLKDYLCNEAGIYPTINRQLELNLSCADMLSDQFKLVNLAKQSFSDFILVLFGQA